ncbi:MAG: cobalamin biosynthesis protein CobQ [Thermoprotei archaeon]|nr:MAG: cobalamin biosynthesis protein CobQ [Thermoprotei archaeon]
MVKKVVVTGGKGGTGKSVVAVNLALALAKVREVVLADEDVEAPNDHILMGLDYGDLRNKEEVCVALPFIDVSKCIKCGLCGKICSESAIVITKEGLPLVIPRLCSGCKACIYACPTKAINEGKRVIGYTYLTPLNIGDVGLTLVTGVLIEGEERSYPVVIATDERAKKYAKDILIVDTAPGSNITVAASINEANLVIAVTEPTPLGAHNLELVLEIASDLGIEYWVVLNRSDIAPQNPVEKVLDKYKARLVMKIPYSMNILESYIKREPIVVYKPETNEARMFFSLAKEVNEVL